MKALAQWTEYFRFMDDLRDSGETNMFGAGLYLREAFDLNRTEAREITIAWMRSFDGGTPSELRAARHLKSNPMADHG